MKIDIDDIKDCKEFEDFARGFYYIYTNTADPPSIKKDNQPCFEEIPIKLDEARLKQIIEGHALNNIYIRI